MKNSKLIHRILHSCKWSSFVLLVGCSVSVFAQTTKGNIVKVQLDSVSGIVYDAVTKKPLAGAQIQALDPKYSAMSDETGAFSIKFPFDLRTLIVSAPDYNKREIPVFKGDRQKIISIYPNAFENYFKDELTVIGQKRRAAVANSQKTITLDAVSSLTLDAELQKKLAADVRLTTHSGAPASGALMLIRGINSLNANSQPLIVVDGSIYDNQTDRLSIHSGFSLNPLANLDMNDIQSISVIKDGTSLYGSKGGNGVIAITTNRGLSMATKITVSAMVGYNQKPSVIPMMNADQYRVYLSDMLKDKVAQSKLTDQFFLNENSDYIYYNKYHNNTNWSDGVYNNSATQSYNIAVNGGDDIALYNLSIGLTNALSTLKKNDFNRINARFNSDINLARNLTTIFDISYLQTDRNLRNDGIDESYEGPINSPGYLSLIKSPFLSPFQYAITLDRAITKKLENYDFLGVANPYAILEYGVGHSQQTAFNLAVVPTYKVSKYMKLSSRFSYSLNNLSENLFSPMYGVAPYINWNLGIYSQNHVKTQFAKQTTIFNDTRLNWEKRYGFNHYEVNAGVRYLQSSFRSTFATGHNTGSDQTQELKPSMTSRTVGGFEDPYKLLTYYGLFNYSLKDKYFLEAAVSAETSSRFGKDAKSGVNFLGVSWGAFPSLNASWLISSEEFMKSVKFVDLMKLRAGYGTSGNDGIQNTSSKSYFEAVKYSIFSTGLQLHNIANSEVQWETVTKRNVGLDLNLFNERVALTVDLFNNTTENLLVLKNLNSITGLDTYWSNDGKLENKGYEVSLNSKVINTQDLKFTLGASVGHYANKILALASGDYKTQVYGGEVLTAVGQSIGQFYGYKTNGVYATAKEAADAGLSTRSVTGGLIPFEAGDVRFVDQPDAQGKKDGVIDENDKVVIGNSNPDFYGLINAGLKYKNFGAQLIFNYSYGNEIYNYLRSQIESGSTFNNQTMALNNRWLAEGQQTTIPKSTFNDPKGNNRFSDRWMEDGSYLRLKTVEVSYELPLKSTYLQGISIWASANNLWTLTKYLGLDPEFSSSNRILYQGIDTGLLPQSKSYFAGVKINL